MKNLASKIKTLALFSALTFSSVKEMKAQESNSSNEKDFLKIGIGQYIWDKNEFNKLMQFTLENERSITKKTFLNFGFDYGTQKIKTDNQNYELTKLSLKLGLNDYFLVSDNKKILIYGGFCIDYTLISENPTKIRDGTAIGINYGGGIENLLNQKTKIFLEIKLNKSEIKGYQKKINLGGTAFLMGLKINLQQSEDK